MRILFLTFGVLLAAFAFQVQAERPGVGDMAPGFEMQGSDGNTYKLSDYRDKQAVVIAWFPRAYTSGCTVECKSLAEKGHLIREYDVSYFMASVDPLEDNIGFAEETGADFPLLSDPDKTVARAFGVLHPMGFASRKTIYIDMEGRVLLVDDKVTPRTSAEDMAANLGALGIARRE